MVYQIHIRFIVSVGKNCVTEKLYPLLHVYYVKLLNKVLKAEAHNATLHAILQMMEALSIRFQLVTTRGV